MSAPELGELLATGVLPRARLLESLLEVEPGDVVAVFASAGYGKTVLAEGWAEHSPVRVLALALGTQKPGTLLSSIAEHVADVVGDGGGTLGTVSDPGHLIDLLAQVHLLLLLDDVHVVSDPADLAVLQALVDHLPTSCTLGLFGRTTPAIKLGRVAVDGRLTRLGNEDLSFRRHELEPLRAMGHRKATLDALHSDSGGWPVAVRWLVSKKPGSTTLPAEDRRVTAYLERAIIDPLPDPVANLLDQLALLESIDLDVLERIADPADPGVRSLLARHPVPLVRVDEDAARITMHPLLVQHLGARLHADPELGQTFGRRFVTALDAAGLYQEAFEAQSRLGWHRPMARYAYARGVWLCMRGELDAVKTWLDVLGALPHPEKGRILVLTAVWSILSGQVAGLPNVMADLASLSPDERADIAMESGFDPIKLLSQAAGLSSRSGRRIVGDSKESPWTILDIILLAYDNAGAGEFDEVLATTLALRPYVKDLPLLSMLNHSLRSHVALVAGDIDTARAALADAERAMLGTPWVRHPLAAQHYAVTSVIQSSDGDTPSARASLARAEALVGAFGLLLPALQISNLTLMAAAALRINDLDASSRYARRAQELIPLCPGEPTFLAARLEQFMDAHPIVGHDSPALSLTDAEAVVLEKLATHYPVSRIAEELFLSPSTVRSHTRSLFRKLNVHSRGDAVNEARALGLLRDPTTPPLPPTP